MTCVLCMEMVIIFVCARVILSGCLTTGAATRYYRAAEDSVVSSPRE